MLQTKVLADPPSEDLARKHILVVEDDDMVRNYVVLQVASFGYRVTEAAHGHSALELLRNNSDIDLLFTDIRMTGGMSGLDLAEAAASLRPKMFVLFTSGDILMPSGNVDHRIEFLQKPYRRHELSQRLHDIFIH